MINTFRHDKAQAVYFVGIGGVSMSSLALILKQRGIRVGGYDLYHSENTALLESNGIEIDYEHRCEKLTFFDAVVYTAAVTPKTAPELPYAAEHNIPALTRAELLGLVTASYRYAVGVSGTHGKSTTTAMLASIYLEHDSESSVLSGAKLPQIDSLFKIGSSDRIVFEACEYKDSFLSMMPSLKVVLNCRLDHVDYFGNLDNYKKSFHTYMDMPRNGEKTAALVNLDCENAVDAARDVSSDVYTFSIKDEDADFCAKNIDMSSGFGVFDLYYRGKLYLNGVHLTVPGLHNVANAVAAAGAAILTDVGKESINKGLTGFRGVCRRFEKKGDYHGAAIYDDYAHHPDEIEATMRVAKSLPFGRVICVFQPHTYTRTEALLPDFIRVLSFADKLYLAEIYPAREVNTTGISSKHISEKIPGSVFADSFDDIADQLRNELKDGDLLITMGAGEAYKVGEILLADES